MNAYQAAVSVTSGLGLLSCAGFCIRWGVRSRMRWAGSEHGWFLMSIAVLLGWLFGMILAFQIFGDWTGRRWVALALYICLFVLTLWFPRILWVSRPEKRRTAMRILGREPALWLAGIQAFIAFLVGFQFSWLSAGQAAVWMAVVNAIFGTITAIMTRPVAPTLFTHLLAVLATLLAAYGLHLSQELVAGLNGLIVAIVMLVVRGEISPAPEAHLTGVLGNKVTTGPVPD